MAGELHIGTSGWIYKSWRGVLYEPGVPQRRWLERYSQSFDTVELNASFYRLPSAAQFAAWKRRTPPGFAFALKGSRLVTHYKKLREVAGDVEAFLAHARELGRKAAVVLWQLPPDLERDDSLLAAFLAVLPRSQAPRQAIEFRHRSWYAPEVYALLERHGAALVLPDSARWEAMRAPEHRLTAPFAYARLHYGEGRRGDYTEEQLEAWAGRVERWRRHRDVFVYFNNDWEGFAVRSASRLRELLGVTHLRGRGGGPGRMRLPRLGHRHPRGPGLGGALLADPAVPRHRAGQRASWTAIRDGQVRHHARCRDVGTSELRDDRQMVQPHARGLLR